MKKMMKESLKISHCVTYDSPSIDMINLDAMEILCSSCGTTQNYGSQDIWGQGEEI